MFRKLAIISLGFFLLSGNFKTFPIFNSLPADLSILAMIIPIAFFIWNTLTSMSMHKSLFIITSFAVVILPTLLFKENDPAKIVNFLLIFFVITFISPVLLKDQKSIKLFLKSLLIISMGIVALVLLGFGTATSNGRLTLNDGNPIGLGRAVSIAALYLLVLLVNNKIKIIKFIIFIVPVLYVLLFTGSKGPAISMLIALFIVYLGSIRKFLVKKVFLRILFFVFASVSVVSILYYFLPNSPITRLFNPQYDNSTYIRTLVYRDALRLITEYPGGIGLGNFGKYSYTAYPHNMILEALVEMGWVSGAAFLLLIIVAFIGLIKFSKQGLYNEMIFGFFIMSFLNAMVTGDLTSPKELYTLIPIGLNSFFAMFSQNKNVVDKKQSYSLLNTNLKL